MKFLFIKHLHQTQRWIYAAVLAAASTAIPARAHEFWFAPVPSPQASGQSVPLRLEVGEFFLGDAAGLSIPQTARLIHYSAAPAQDLKPFLSPDAPEAEVLLNLTTAGNHLFTFESEPLQITLSADRFHAYLHDEGLDFIKTQREAAGTAERPGRERYRRHIKTLIQVGPTDLSDQRYGLRVGQRLEITPLNNPFLLTARQPLTLQVEFEGKPLAGALVKAWHAWGGEVLTIRARTSAEGRTAIRLPYAGAWMFSVVHMVPALGADDVDWDSHWGNLTFSLPSAP